MRQHTTLYLDEMNNVLSMPYLNNGVYPSPPISDPSLSRQYDYIQDRDGFYDPPLSGEMLDNEFEGLDDRDKMRGGSLGYFGPLPLY